MGGGHLSKVCIDVQHLEIPTSSGILASPVIPGPPKIEARRYTVREFYTSKQDLIINPETHTKSINQCASTARQARPGRAHSLGYRASSRPSHPERVLKQAGFGQDRLKVVGMADAASREPWMPPRLGRFQVSKHAQENPVRESELDQSKARAEPEQGRNRAGALEARPTPRQPRGEDWTRQYPSQRSALLPSTLTPPQSYTPSPHPNPAHPRHTRRAGNCPRQPLPGWCEERVERERKESQRE